MIDTFIVICPDGQEHAGAIDMDRRDVNYAVKELCSEALKRYKYKGSRINPTELTCQVKKLVVKDGNIKHIPWNNIEIYPELAPLTQDEYDTELQKALKKIPGAFHTFVVNWAYEHGHSAGYEECLAIAENLIAELRPAIHGYDLASH